MNTIGALIATVDPDFLLLSKKDQTILVMAVLLYVFRVIESTELSDYFKEHLNWTGQSCIDFRKIIQGKGYIQKYLKLYIYAKLCGTKPDAEAYNIKDVDVEFVKKIKTTHALGSKLIKFCQGRMRVGYKVRKLKEFNGGVERVTQDWITTCSKFVAKKFKFLTQSGQTRAQDLVQELLFSGIYAVYRAYPEIDDLLHLKNIGITAIHNRGVNMLIEHTSKSRKRLVKNEDGTFSGTLLSMNVTDFDSVFSNDGGAGAGGAMIACNALMVGIDGVTCEHERPTDVDRQRDLRITVERIMTKMGSSRARQFTSILMGVYDEGFTKYLGKPNDEMADKMQYIEYSEKARQYMGIEPAKAKTFVKRLRNELKDYRP